MRDESAAVLARRVVKAQRRRIAAVDEDQTFQALRQGRQRKLLRSDFAAASDLNLLAFDDAEKPLSGALADVSHGQQREVLLFCGGHDGRSQGVL
jgi:hypothetical protein